MTCCTAAWIHSRNFDSAFILAPPFLVSLLILGIPELFAQANEVSLAWWVGLVLCVDVAHVYSTLYRSYLDPHERRNRGGLLLVIPLACWFVGVILYAAGSGVFWSVLAYLAVFHFVRQQYGFFMIYSRVDPVKTRGAKWIDKAAIYLATIYPLTFWHTHLPRNFEWFIKGDFVALDLQALSRVVGALYLAVLVLYAWKEVVTWRRAAFFNGPKQALLLGTALSWYIGIVLCNGDMAFTLTNVVAHGIPYMALVWIYGRRRWRGVPDRDARSFLSRLFAVPAVPLFLGFLLILAYLEEALWDALVWRDREALFSPWYALPHIDSSDILVWLIPLLAVPQATHYVLDGFLWRLNRAAKSSSSAPSPLSGKNSELFISSCGSN
jgi:hypothetical protein